jgi:hypothetical protein
MRITTVYLCTIGLLIYMTYINNNDKYKHQEAEVHRQFCASYTFHPDCKK